MPSITHCRQESLGAIRVSGRDARNFLHAQLTQDIAGLPADRSTLAAWLNARGRVRALFDVVPSGESFLLLTAADNIGQTVRELGLFVLRADVGVEAAADLSVHALVGESADWLAARDLSLGPRQVAVMAGVTWLRAGPSLVQAIGQPSRVAAALAGSERGDPATAELAAIRMGLPVIPAALRERYIPQMLNLERLDAVSFSKGCYPGQEIVARTQNLGAVKRRLRPFATGPGTSPQPGESIVDDSGTAVGEVNRAAPTSRGHALLAVVQLESLGSQLRLAADDRAVEPLPATDAGD